MRLVNRASVTLAFQRACRDRNSPKMRGMPAKDELQFLYYNFAVALTVSTS
jgi:hypothetical protein